jgi:hypothetical protein
MKNEKKPEGKLQTELTILLPCLNEAETLAICINKAQKYIKKCGISGEVLVADNGSNDGSQAIAHDHGARVVHVRAKGYGAALMGGIEAAHGRFIIMADADDSYELDNLASFIEKLQAGYDLVMGNRFKGGIKRGAMPWHHWYIGNPILSGIGNIFFGNHVHDFHCGIRGFRKEAIQKLALQTMGMEFASEMIVKAIFQKLKITEVPTTLSPDGRNRPPHLRSWRDGWRHLRFLLIFSPRWLFLYPGLFLAGLGSIILILLFSGPKMLFGVTFDIHTMLYAALSTIIGVQVIAFSIFSQYFAVNIHLLYEDERFNTIVNSLTLERGLIAGGALSLLGLSGAVWAFLIWKNKSFGALDPVYMMRITIPSLTCLAIGIQVIFSSFFLSVLRIKHK